MSYNPIDSAEIAEDKFYAYEQCKCRHDTPVQWCYTCEHIDNCWEKKDILELLNNGCSLKELIKIYLDEEID